MHNGRLQGVLAVSRAFGDVEHKRLKEKCWETEFSADPLICEPVCVGTVWLCCSGGWECDRRTTQEVRVHSLQPRDEFVILASDGLWDVLSSQQAVNFTRRRLACDAAVRASARWSGVLRD